MNGVVLSRTALGSQFCFCLHDYTTNSQIRPLLSNDRYQEKFGLQTPQSRYLYDNIWPGTILEYDVTQHTKISPRVTHPEDTLIIPSLKIIGKATDTEYKRIVSLYTFPSIKDFIPSLKDVHMKSFVNCDELLIRSVGYIVADSLKIHTLNDFNNKKKVRILVVDKKAHTTTLPLKDVWQEKFFLENIENGGALLYDDVTLRLSLSGPFNPNQIWEKDRCYLQVSRIELN